MWLSAQISIGNDPSCVKSVNAAARQAAVKHSVTFVDRENFTGELKHLVDGDPSIKRKLSRDGMHYEAPFTGIIFQYLSESVRCVLNS